MFFTIDPPRDHALICHQVKDKRIHPNSVDQVLPNSAISGPLYVKTCIFFKIPNGGCGLLCALIDLEEPNTWKVGIVHQI